jgi:hypothetical protein
MGAITDIAKKAIEAPVDAVTGGIKSAVGGAESAVKGALTLNPSEALGGVAQAAGGAFSATEGLTPEGAAANAAMAGGASAIGKLGA